MSMGSVFTELLHTRSKFREDFLTVCFAKLLEEWSRTDVDSFHGFMLWFSKIKDGNCVGSPKISHHKSAGFPFGVPDLSIEFKDSLVIVENKWDAPPDPEQIRKYRAYLDGKQSGVDTSLVFIKKSPRQVDWGDVRPPDNDITWMKIYAKLNDLTHLAGEKSRLAFLAAEFCQFLEDYGMSGKPVGRGYMDFVSLMNMIKQALDELANGKLIKLSRTRSHQGWWGYYFCPKEKKEVWFGQIYEGHPNRLLLTPGQGFENPPEELFPMKREEGRARPFDLDEAFFSSDAEEQRKKILGFLQMFLRELEMTPGYGKAGERSRAR